MHSGFFIGFILIFFNIAHLALGECNRNNTRVWVCDGNAECIVIDGSFECQFKDGFVGSGFDCEGKKVYEAYFWRGNERSVWYKEFVHTCKHLILKKNDGNWENK